MTPQEAVQSVGRKVYGLGGGADLIETFTVVSYEDAPKKSSVCIFTLQPDKGSPFKAGINDFFLTELDALLLASRCVDDYIMTAEKEIDNLQHDIVQFKKQQMSMKRRIKKLEHLATLKK